MRAAFSHRTDWWSGRAGSEQGYRQRSSNMTKAQVNKLGERLRGTGPPSDDDLVRLQVFRDEYDEPMASAQERLQEALRVDRIETTARLKTTNTIVEKLRREKTRLSEMQDIAGIRIVASGGLVEQDLLVGRVAAIFPGAKMVDRRKRPSHGYRAVHQIVRVDGFLVEIQVRTDLQNLWAQAFERFADRAGREIRYGSIPAGCEQAVEEVLTAAREVALIEQQEEELRELTAKVAGAVMLSLGPRELGRVQVRVGALRATLGQRVQLVRGFLNQFVGGVGAE